MKNEDLKRRLKHAMSAEKLKGLHDTDDGFDLINPEEQESISGGQQDRDVPDCAGFSCATYKNCGAK